MIAQTHIRKRSLIHAMPAVFSVLSPIIPPTLCAHTPFFSPPRGTRKYTLSFRQKELQGALKLALAAPAALQACTSPPSPPPLTLRPYHLHLHPIPIHPLSICMPLYSLTPTPLPTVALSLRSIQCLYDLKVKVISNLFLAFLPTLIGATPQLSHKIFCLPVLHSRTAYSISLFSFALPQTPKKNVDYTF